MEIGCWLKGRKMTNFEKIRQLSEEEMAKYIFDLEMGLREIPYCQGNDRCSYLMDSGREIPESMCTEREIMCHCTYRIIRLQYMR